MKNANGRNFDTDHRQSSSSQFKGQDKGKKDAKEGGQYTVPTRPKCFGCQGFGHMKHECPTYLMSIGKSKALAASLSNTEPEKDSDNEDDGILNAFTATVNPTDGIVEDVELDHKELSTKFDEANQAIGALRFENNFLAEKTKKLEAELFQVRAQLERTSSAKLGEMLSILKSASDRTSLAYGISSSNTASTSTTVFVPPASNTKIKNIDVKISLASEKLDKGKSILRAPPKLEKKEAKNPKAKKANSQKPKQKKQHLCHHCEAASHTRPNCYKWLAT